MIFRAAGRGDVDAIVKMLAEDKLGELRENYQDPLPQSYYDAFEEIDQNPNIELTVAENESGEIVGTLQLSFIRDMTYQGGCRAFIEAVRVRQDLKGQGVGQQLFEWAIERAKEKGAHVLQLTTDKRRPEAKRFYEKLGFKNTHEGMKYHF
ncbi:GNAT family N-acetyltransferase [bacterium AH-315-C20]|nr:GNAT family N-acetyltransferase [bacterium AH-315-C20]